MREGQSYITSISIFKQESRDKIRAGSGFIHKKGWDSWIKKKKIGGEAGRRDLRTPFVNPRRRPNEKMKTSALRKFKYYISLILAVSNITTTVAPLTHR